MGINNIIAKPVQILQPEKDDIITIINNARANVLIPALNLTTVTWDYPLESDLNAFLPTNRSWLFENSTRFNHSVVDIVVKFNLMFLMREPKFSNYSGYNYVFHDTCNLAKNDVSKIFRYRVNQKKCFTYKKCDPLQFTNFQTCNTAPVPRITQTPCSWYWRYYTALIRQDLKTIACVRFSHPGPYTPNKQKDSFGCYGKLANATNDVPYTAKPKSLRG